MSHRKTILIGQNVPQKNDLNRTKTISIRQKKMMELRAKLEYDVEKISHKIRNKKRTKKVIKFVILTSLIVLFIVNLILSVEEKTHIFGIYMFNIISESMEPTFYKDDLAIVKSCNIEDLKVGDIITFKQEDRIISHRISEMIAEKGEKQIITKGDNNKVVDTEPVDIQNIYGKVVWIIPKIGKFVNYIQNVRGFMNICILIVIICILVNSRDNKINNRKIKRKKYEIKKLRDSYKIEG